MALAADILTLSSLQNLGYIILLEGRQAVSAKKPDQFFYDFKNWRQTS